MTHIIGPGTLKCVSGWSPGRSLHPALEAALAAHAGANGVRRLGDALFIVYSDAGTAELRDQLAQLLAEGESLFVAEVERWSSCGPGIDTSWLLRRGH